MSVDYVTECEQRLAYFDGAGAMATKKGVNIPERGSHVHFVAEFQEVMDFPPAPGSQPALIGRDRQAGGPTSHPACQVNKFIGGFKGGAEGAVSSKKASPANS
jgi:hypothetical protein